MVPCSEFNEAYSAFSIRTYDVLDPEEAAFGAGFRAWKARVRGLEERLGLVVEAALGAALTPGHFVKVADAY